MLTVKAPAKINLTLEVLRKRVDGYHEIRSVLQAIDMCDILHLEPGKGVSVRGDMPGWDPAKSLVSCVIELLKKATSCYAGVSVEIEKRIPLLSGLGGDSSDAAALLSGLNELWKLSLTPEKLRELAGQMGSDTAFFLGGGTALAKGRGEKITTLPVLPKMWVVLVVPDIPVGPGKTARMYASLRPEHFTDGSITQKLVKTMCKADKFNASLLFNTFENTAYESYPGLSVYKEHLIKLGATHVHLAGSGPVLFTISADKEKAEDLFIHCKYQRMNAILAATL